MILSAAACTVSQPSPTAGSPSPTPVQSPTLSKAVSPDSPERIELADSLYLRQVGEGAFVVTDKFPWMSNSVLVEMADGTLVLAGSTNTPEAARNLLDWIAQQFDERKMVAINTGYHADNLGGNQALIEAGIPVYGSDLTAQLITERSERVRQSMLDQIGDPQAPAYQAQLDMVYLPPDHTFPLDEGLTLTFGGEEVIVFYPGPSQAPDKVAVYFPSRKLLFGSCMILGWDGVGNIADADLKAWPDAVHKLLQFEADVIVPGHGERLDPGLIQHTLDLLEAMP